MDRGGISGLQSGAEATLKKRRKSRGLVVKERDGYWHISGTLRVAGRSIRVRRTTGIPASRPWEEGDAVRHKVEEEIRQQEIHGKRPSVAFARAAVEYLKNEQPGPTDINNAADLGQHFGTLTLDEITEQAISGFLTARHSNNAPSTCNRALRTLSAILNFAKGKKWVDALPTIPYRKEKKSQGADKWLFAEEVMAVYEEAETHAKPIIAVLACTGARVSEVVYLNVRDFILAEGRERAILRDTKNGESYGVPLHPWAAEVMRNHIGNRQAGKAFLTPKGQPYVDREKKRGGQIAGAWDGAKRRVAKQMIKEALEQKNAGNLDRAEFLMERAAIVEQSTPHWLRHNFASQLIMAGESTRAVMEAGRWKSSRLVDETYGHLAPDHARQAINRLPFSINKSGQNDTKLTRSKNEN